MSEQVDDQEAALPRWWVEHATVGYQEAVNEVRSMLEALPKVVTGVEVAELTGKLHEGMRRARVAAVCAEACGKAEAGLGRWTSRESGGPAGHRWARAKGRVAGFEAAAVEVAAAVMQLGGPVVG